MKPLSQSSLTQLVRKLDYAFTLLTVVILQRIFSFTSWRFWLILGLFLISSLLGYWRRITDREK